jgi:hypothetical protein
MLASARTAWAYVSRNAPPAGFAPAHETYRFVTVWDIASNLAAAYSARELGIISSPDYDARMDRLLRTLRTMPLYDDAAPNKLYASGTATMVDRAAETSRIGYGWSVVDVGRLLIWLRIVAKDSAHAAAAHAVVARYDMSRMVANGYLQGADVDATTKARETYQEGRIGYEQYAAEGFALWGTRAERALDFSVNGEAVTVGGQSVLKDRRGGDLLTSEPFVAMGIELGWPGATWRPLSLSILAAQEARYRSTGTITMVSEDAVPEAPAFFYYYLLYRDGKSFVVAAPGGATSDSFPRWVSAKAAFGYQALAPSDYTWKAVQAVASASTANRGWTAGVIENTRRSTKSYNMNTAALVLESALYSMRGCAIILPRCPAKASTAE